MSLKDYIDELRGVINGLLDQHQNETISYEDHCKQMQNMLTMLETESEEIEYAYVFKNVDDEIICIGNQTVTQRNLKESLIVFEPMDDFENVDMNSLVEQAKHIAENDGKNVLILPPGVVTMSAVPAGYIEHDDYQSPKPEENTKSITAETLMYDENENEIYIKPYTKPESTYSWQTLKQIILKQHGLNFDGYDDSITDQDVEDIVTLNNGTSNNGGK